MTQQDAQVFNDRYELVSHVARGGMAQVYLARDLLLDRPVALKVLFPELSIDQAFVKRFRREAQAAANLTHPNIVSIYDWGEGARTYFIVMEYVDGRTLAQLIADGPLDPARAASIAADVAGALAFAHRHGVIHRDVKPGNVLIDNSGQVKVTDFGIARAVGGGAQEGLTQTGAVMGTATYFSPEQAQGQPVDARSDIYSLGVVLYEMVTGRIPFAGDNPVAIAYKHVREDPIAPTQVNKAVPAPLEAIVLQAMAKDPALRYQTADEFQADLMRYVRGAPVLADPPPPTVMMPATRVEPALAAAPDELEEPGGRRTGFYIAVLLIMLAVLAGLLFLLGKQLGLFDKSSSKEVTIPADIIGADAATAQSELQNLGLKVQVQQQTSDIPQGKVIDSQPKPQTTVKTHSTVTLIVSGGPQLVQLPDVRGQDVNQATATLTQSGFHVTTSPQASDSAPVNQVIAQNPGPGQASKGSTVTLTVSTGKTKVTIPDESGHDSNAASNDLGNLGLKTRTLYEASSSFRVGQVTRTDPPANASVDTGSTVLIYVSTGSGQVQVPDVRNLTRAQAQAALAADSLQFTVSTAPVTDPAQDGVVIAQSPNPGSTVGKGSTVAITVGQFTPPPTTATTAAPTGSTTPQTPGQSTTTLPHP
jgi:beta-lactam-binding protein with PASTA domain/tRNA A-37 threonylcarbamoyl transferase component Bud32